MDDATKQETSSTAFDKLSRPPSAFVAMYIYNQGFWNNMYPQPRLHVQTIGGLLSLKLKVAGFAFRVGFDICVVLVLKQCRALCEPR